MSSAAVLARALAVAIRQLTVAMPMAVTAVTPMVATLAHKYLHRSQE
ncbi:MAG: hypothetical protein WCC17_09040 [Candidatus Nitrosopolaris sp.]